jgi:integrase
VGGPVSALRRPRNAEVREREFLTPVEVEQLAVAAKRRRRYGSRDAFAIRFAARHGFRVSELCALTWDSIDLAGGWLHVTAARTGFPAHIPCSAMSFAISAR